MYHREELRAKSLCRENTNITLYLQVSKITSVSKQKGRKYVVTEILRVTTVKLYSLGLIAEFGRTHDIN